MIPQELIEVRAMHSKAIQTAQDCSNDLAEAEYEYDTAYASAIAVLRNEGVPMSIITHLAKGTPEVAGKMRDVAIKTGVLKAAQARVQATYLDWKLAAEQYEREWRQLGVSL